jgi:cytidyltransferase-like protein
MKRMYRHVILGGTFDRFHVGHSRFLSEALRIGKKITIGVTMPALYKHKSLSSIVEPYEVRENHVRNFLSRNAQTRQKISLIALHNVYGISFDDTTPEAIVVTEATKIGAIRINEERRKRHMKPLDIIVVPLVLGTDGRVVSSERIRYGEINRMGLNYYETAFGKKDLKLPDKLKPILREPLGDVFTGGIEERDAVVKQIMNTIRMCQPAMIYAIGDIITLALRSFDVIPSIAVIDGRSRRKALTHENFRQMDSELNTVYPNPAGTIAHLVVVRMRQAQMEFLNKKTPATLVLDGEEDLIALPAILIAPLGSFVLYGQHNLGVVSVKVTEEKKEQALELLMQFKR